MPVATISDAAELLAALVAAPSLNPQGEPPARRGSLYGEAQAASVVETYARALPGAQVVREAVAEDRWNVLLRFSAVPSAGGDQGARPALVFCTHLDTVGIPPGDEALLAPRRVGERLFGRGACDAKGSLAAMLLAARALAAVTAREDGSPAEGEPAGSEPAGGEPPLDVVFAFVADEEYGALGARALAGRIPRIAAALLGEPTSLAVVAAHRGGAKWRVRTLGRAAHTSRAEAGVNAIYAMGRVLRVIEEELPKRLADLRHPLCGGSAVHATLIQGGRDPNTVPDACTIEINCRLSPSVPLAPAIAEIGRFLVERTGDLGGATLEIEPPYFTLPGLDTPAGSRFVQAVRAAAVAAAGSGAIEGRPYGSDAPFLAANGAPAVLLGPGSELQAHADDEWISLGDVCRAAGIYADLAERALTGRLTL